MAKKIGRSSSDVATQAVLRAIRKAKPSATGRAFRAMHEAESKLMVASGAVKSRYRPKAGKKRRRRKAKKTETE